jgi:endonuclease/exonuclease/phosphatase family metal-dependent hydrolase
MKCMTFNIWNYQRDWRRRRDLIARLIDAHRPDVVALQETRHDPRYERGRGQGEQLAELLGYHLTSVVAHAFVPFLRVNEGLSILTSSPPLRVMQRRLTRASLLRRALDPAVRADGNQRVCLGVAVRAGVQEAHIYDTHFSLSGQGRLRNAIEVTRFIWEESGETPAVLMGDLNADPTDPPLRYLRGELTVQGQTGGFVDCWTAVHPGDAGLTDETWNPRRRIDYVLGRNLPAPPTDARLVGCDPVDGIYPSDHRGILVDFPF